MLLDKGAIINPPGLSGCCPPLVAAARGGHLEVVKLLLRRGAQLNGQDRNGDTPLFTATVSENVDVTKTILKFGQKTGANMSGLISNDVMKAAVGCQKSEILSLLIELGGDVDQTNADDSPPVMRWKRWQDAYAPLTLAIRNSCPTSLRVLIQHGADVNQRDPGGRLPLAMASAGHPEELSILLEAGANMRHEDLDKGNLLNIAAHSYSVECLSILVQHGAEIKRDAEFIEDTPLGHALLRDQKLAGHEVVEHLLEYGVDHRKATRLGTTALMLAAHQLDPRIVKSLLDHGADSTRSNQQRGTALTVALNSHLPDSRRYFIKATEERRSMVVQQLLKSGVDVNCVGGRWGSALGAAAALGDELHIKLLIKHGADFNLQTEWGTPLDIAQASGNSWAADVLISHGATNGNSPEEAVTRMQDLSKQSHFKITEQPSLHYGEDFCNMCDWEREWYIG